MSEPVHGEQADLNQPHDLEAGEKQPVVSSDNDSDGDHHAASEDEAARAHELQSKVGILAFLRRQEDKLDEKMGIETQGVDRILEENKKPPSILNVFLLWWSLTAHVGTLPVGVLGPEFGLSLGQSVAGIVAGTVLGALCTAYTGTLGPKLGLRAIATSRYSFGFYGAKLCSILNIVIGGGFAVVNVVVVGQILSAVSNYSMPIEVGCIIIAILGYIISIFGFKLIHTFEKYSWIMNVTILVILIAMIGDKIDASAPSEDTGLGFAGSFLSFLAINFSSASGWCSIASDYYCNYPASTKSWKIFFLTFFGIAIPTTFVTVIGACVGNAVLVNGGANNPVLYDAYENHGLGGALRESFHPIGFSKFLLVLLSFSVLGNNVAVNYSSGLSLQLLGHYFHAVPRFIWSFLNALVIAVLAIAGREHLSTVVSNFVSLLGYWTVSFTFILLIEDQFFRRQEGYNLTAWDNPHKLPWGVAAVSALLVGYLAGGVTGMSQTWYIGPIAAKFGGYGGDVGVYLSGALTILVYFPARWYERKVTSR